MDQLSESYSSTSPYAYVGNNPAMNYDPDGRVTNDWMMGFWYGSGSGSTTWTNTGDGFTSDRTYSNGMTGHFSYGGEFTMSNMIQEVVIQAKGNSNTWNSSVNYAFNSLSLMSGIRGAIGNWYGEQARSRLHAAMGDNIADDLQGMLDGFGTIPFFGEVADGMNGLISLGRGNRGQAALSFGAMVPFLGWGATAFKYGKGINVVATDFNKVLPTQDWINPAKVLEYKTLLMKGEKIPAIEAYVQGGRTFIEDGHHRFVAYMEVGIKPVITVKNTGGPVGFPNWLSTTFQTP
ncbi:hypothetical protein [Epilithonimonas hungarica]|uniref:RHS repeat-associated core domain-containing protein n=1 Tax=Epilithonimonas hungarica TaxID=454006 RepID=A0A1G7W466_9FLAO|nr:hypothetical protein [Epilithonimonas hungarica]SDG65970.1 hypothetical protein SAMN05421825_3781 [Epilithonimonas hungarica]